MQPKTLSRLGRLMMVCVVGTLLLSSWSFAAAFSADGITKAGPMQMMAKTYVSGNKVRQDVSFRDQRQVVIMRGDKRLTWILDQKKKQYMEMPGAGNTMSAAAIEAQLRPLATKKSLGKQMVNGFSCDKSVYTFKDKQKGTMTVCVARQLDWPMRTEIKSPRGAMTIEYKNVKMGTPPASTFELPKGYKKAQMQSGPPPGARRPAPPAKRK